MKLLAFLLLFLALSGCAPSGRYSQYHDSAPVRKPTQLEMKDAVTTAEPIGRGNNPYTIKGINYTPQTSRQSYEQTGTASWYGKKFHGHLTSNGEVYDMYAMTAAHKTLPLPSFVKVTNLTNNKSAIVRVNDRGPFHGNRIIDLSYSAAYKIGVFDTGTAPVKIEVLLHEPKPEYQIALSGFKSFSEAQESARGLSLLLDQETKAAKQNQQVVLLLGPYKDKKTVNTMLNKVKQLGFNNAEIKTLAPN